MDEKFFESLCVNIIELSAKNDHETENMFQIINSEVEEMLNVKNDELTEYNFYGFPRVSKDKKRRYESFGNAYNNIKFIIDRNFSNNNISKEVFEIRFNINPSENKWAPWQAIPGKFIVLGDYRFAPSGIADSYSEFTKENYDKSMKNNIQIRFSGYMPWNFTIFDDVHRVIGDPVNENIVKIVDNKTYQILFDSSSSSYDSVE